MCHCFYLGFLMVGTGIPNPGTMNAATPRGAPVADQETVFTLDRNPVRKE
jgi:hypothetical protein